MSKEPETESRFAALARAIKCQIVRRTGGRIRMLEVEVMDSGVIIHGCASCYYLKQLALQGAHDVLGATGPSPVALNVQVVHASVSRVDAQ